MANKHDKYEQLLDCSCNKIRSASRKITQLYEGHLREAAIKPTQFTILGTLANTGALLLTELADTLSLERTGLTRNLTVLERNGWVQVDTGPEDLRQRIVSLTPQGYRQLDLTIPYWKKAQLTVAQELGQDELMSLRNTLDALTQTLSD